MKAGPLSGLRVVEFAGIGPAPFCAMLLADMGADVLRIDRPGGGASLKDVTARGRGSLALDLKVAEDLQVAVAAVTAADVLIEGFRPGVMERLGLGPDVLQATNPRLVYGRMTGWGQTGPLAQSAGHDINYIALTGALDAIGEKDGPPVVPLNLVGDYGGGALYLAMGVLAAVYERHSSGLGQVIDAAVVDGASSLMSVFSWLAADKLTSLRRGENMLGGAAPNYRTYACADGRYVAVGPLEPRFHSVLREALGLDPTPPADSEAEARELSNIFVQRPRDEWAERLEGGDACVAPVLSLQDAPRHPHMAARQVFIDIDGVIQPAPAPRFSRTPSAHPQAPVAAGVGGGERLAAWGVDLPPR